MTERKEKHKQKLKERGITLIALVITIIVLLILAGVALSALTGDSGILINAESAKKNTNLANAKEQIELAVQGARLEGVTKGNGNIDKNYLVTELDRIVKNYSISGEDDGPWIVKIGDYRVEVFANGYMEKARDTDSLKGILTTEGTTPWLPEGFSRVAEFTEGLVISNTTNRKEVIQNYVWIEVPTIEQTIKLSDGTEQTINLGKAKTDEEIIETLQLYAGKGTDYDYTKGSSSQNEDWTDEWYDSTGKNKNTQGANKNDDKGCGMTYSQYEVAYSSMLKSIQKYGGFWIAQYEAGLSYEEGNRASYSEIIVSRTNYAKDKYPYNWVSCSQAQKIANVDSTNEYISSLPFGIQWDLVCKFLEVKKAKTYAEIAKNSKWGNYSNTYWTSSANSKYSSDLKKFEDGTCTKSSGAYLLTTGAIESTTASTDASPMDIYDFAGNVWEWTLEYTENNNTPCSIRGGYSNLDGEIFPASSREYSYPYYNHWRIGFRSVLY